MDRSHARLCLVTDRALARGRPLADIVSAAVRGGVTMVQLREKDCTTREFLTEARALKALLAPMNVPLVINDRVDIALAVEADGVHVGQKDMPASEVRRLVGPRMIIGLSANTPAHLAAADTAAADYLGMGPIFAQTTKADASRPLGIEGFAALRSQTRKPVLAIGGVKAEHLPALRAAGADGVAVVSAIIAADDPEHAALEFLLER